ncbi:hypothetical protein BJV74DRAFT_807389 [Russula compacta]|nr:hypothetical protein BJV74DRAFT_807389 [Russula compacta]
MPVGGIDSHRFDLSSMIMLKDNHVLVGWANGLASVAQHLRERWTSEGKKSLLETSGGRTESNLRERAIAGDPSSVHQSAPHIDFSLKIQMPPR